jgi:hypothetical protein
METDELWRFLPLGYVATVAVELPILLLGLARRHPVRVRVLAGFWLTACTYPVVVLALPPLFGPEARWVYLAVAETFAPLAECALFSLAYHAEAAGSRGERLRDWAAIVGANLASFLLGEAYYWLAQQPLIRLF